MLLSSFLPLHYFLTNINYKPISSPKRSLTSGKAALFSVIHVQKALKMTSGNDYCNLKENETLILLYWELGTLNVCITSLLSASEGYTKVIVFPYNIEASHSECKMQTESLTTGAVLTRVYNLCANGPYVGIARREGT